MSDLSKLITAIGSLLGAIAWPVVIAGFLVAFRREMRSLFERLPLLLDRLKRMKIAGVEAELDALAAKASEKGEVTAEQTRAATQIAFEAKAVGNVELLSELDKLCLQYDVVRKSMRSGHPRTHEMTKILVKMRALAPSTSDRIDVYKSSGSAGRRLAAIAMMQMEPEKADIEWLLERFKKESPFIFYHAALALTNAASSRSGASRDEVIATAAGALRLVEAFEGQPDSETIEVLRSLTTSP